MTDSYIKPALLIILISVCFFSGYKYNDYRRDSEELAITKVVNDVRKIFEDREHEAAKNVEETLKKLRANEKVIEKRTVEVIERPVYLLECYDDDGLDIINSYGRGVVNGYY